MSQDFNDFLTDNIDKITKESDCPLEHASFMKELMQEEFEKFKQSLSRKYNARSLFPKAIEKNNLDLFKKILSRSTLDFRHYLDDIFKYGRKEMLDEILTKEISQHIFSSYKIYFMTAVYSNFIEGQQVILNHFVPAGEKDAIKNELLKAITGDLAPEILRNIFTSPLLKEYVNANDIKMDYNVSYIEWSVKNKKRDVFDILMSNDMVNPIDLYGTGAHMALYYSIIEFKEEPEKLKDSYYFNHFLYDKKIVIEDKFLNGLNRYSELKNQVIHCMEKRDLLFKMENDFNNDKSHKKVKL